MFVTNSKEMITPTHKCYRYDEKTHISYRHHRNGCKMDGIFQRKNYIISLELDLSHLSK